MPTFFEKLTWSPGDGYGLRVAETQYGKIGALICGENTNPLARYSLMARGEQVHISTWPAVWPTSVPETQNEDTHIQCSGPPEVEKRTNYDNVSANRMRAAAHCFENKCFGILCTGFLDRSNIETLSSETSDPEYVSRMLEQAPRGASMFLNPTGSAIQGFSVDDSSGKQTEQEFLQDREGVLYAELDLSRCVEGKQYHDVVGGYQRLDVFDLEVNRSRRDPATFFG
jgi:nitrilase